VQPNGQGAFNEAGIAFYERLVDGLVARGIKPYLTLNHWDLPQALQDAGGWAHRDTAQRFVEYARFVAARLGDRVVAITTHNEPWVMAVLGHETGLFAPGIRHRSTAMQVAHHLLLSHGLALQALRADGCPARLGIVLNLSPIGPATDSAEDVAAARLEDGRSVRWYMDPLFKGEYPADVWQHLGGDVPHIEPGDLAAIATPMDFLGINYYTRGVVSASGAWNAKTSGKPLTDMGWEIVPEGLTELLLRMHRDWTLPPLYVKENGAAFQDTLVLTPAGGRVHDVERTDYIASHIAAVGDAMAQGVPMAGYMVWSLLDNFEWASGYAKRFGIVHVDYATLQRTPKDSYLWYREFLLQQQRARQQALAV
jgi:beta-glucosidase